MVELLSFACGVVFGIVLTCAACSQVKAVANGSPTPPPETSGYYGGPPPLGHPEISQAMNELQHARRASVSALSAAPSMSPGFKRSTVAIRSYLFNSSSNAFASFRSAVSKPSVNRL